MRDFNSLMKEIKQSNEFLETKIRNSVAIQIAGALKNKNMTQADLAAAVGVSSAYVSRILSGSENFSVKTLVKFVRAVDADANITLSIDRKDILVERTNIPGDDIDWRLLDAATMRKHGSPVFGMQHLGAMASNEHAYQEDNVIKFNDRISSAA